MILLIDNYDSFTYNIVQYLGVLGGVVHVIPNDAWMGNEDPDYLVIGPGPGNPTDAGISKTLLKKFLGKIPILGVCLGHQCIGDFFGARVLRAKKPMHGKLSSIYHDEKGLFKGMKQPFSAVRYHSLIVDRETLSNELIISAETEDGEIMGLTHTHYPLFGVQFHPESVSTENGLTIFQNFLNLGTTSC